MANFKAKLSKVPQFVQTSRALETQSSNVSGLCLPIDSKDPNQFLTSALNGGGILKLVHPDSGREVQVVVQPFLMNDKRIDPSDITQHEFRELQKIAESVSEEKFAIAKKNADLLQQEVTEQVSVRVKQQAVRKATSSRTVPDEMRQSYLLLPAAHLQKFQNLNFTPLSDILHRLRRTHEEAVRQPHLLSVFGPNAHVPINRRPPDILEELETFAKAFRHQRIDLGFSQQDFSTAMTAMYNADVSQTTVSRFEALNLTIRNMRRLRPTLERWIEDVSAAAREEETGVRQDEEPAAAGSKDIEERCVEIRGAGRMKPLMVRVKLDEFWVTRKRRRKKTLLDKPALDMLEAIFRKTTMPPNDRITSLAGQLGVSRSVIRAWFCNRRFRMRRMCDLKNAKSKTGSTTCVLNLTASELGRYL